MPSDPSEWRRRFFLWRDDSLIKLPTLGGPGTDFWRETPSLNNTGSIAYTTDLPAEDVLPDDDQSVIRAVLWKDGELVELETLGGRNSGAHDINDRGQIVGWSETEAGAEHACIWEDGSVRDLNDLLPARLGFSLARALGINEAGVIVAQSLDTQAFGTYVMLIPSSSE